MERKCCTNGGLGGELEEYGLNLLGASIIVFSKCVLLTNYWSKVKCRMSKVRCRMSGVECHVNKVILSLSLSLLRIWFKVCGINADTV